jgi:TM2 domain-containing membrane protein YozV
MGAMPFCKNCGTQYSEGTKFCSNCGAALEGAVVAAPVAAVAVSKKDAGVAALLAGLVGLFLFGIGHFYVGKIGRGVVFLVVGIIVKIGLAFFWLAGMVELMFVGAGAAFGLLILIALLNLGLWIWQIYDAYALAKRYNAEVERTGKAPW